MIYTVTLNPSIDFIVRLKKLELGQVNRMESDDKYAGGKGINVSRVLKRISSDSIALGFLGGFTGKFIEDSLLAEGISNKFIKVSEDTRINVKIKAGEETEINGQGPDIPADALIDFIDHLGDLGPEDIVVFAGSAPVCLGNKVYRELIPEARATGAQVVCDFEGQTLLDSLDYQPLLVKPNNFELEDIFKVKFENQDDIVLYARKLLEKGAQNVIISMAGDGAIMVNEAGSYFAEPIKGVVKNSVGAGDSMVAGFTGQYAKSHDALEAFKWGVACGTATAFSDDLADSEFIKETLKQVKIKKI